MEFPDVVTASTGDSLSFSLVGRQLIASWTARKMADATSSRHSRQGRDKGKRPRAEDPEEGTSRGRPNKSRAVSAPSATKPSREEERRHKAIEKAFDKAASASQAPAKRAAAPKSKGVSTIQPLQDSHPPPPPPQAPSPASTPALSPDRSTFEGDDCGADAASVFPVDNGSFRPAEPAPHALPNPTPGPNQVPQPLPEITPALASLISEAIRQGISQGLQQKADQASEPSAQTGAPFRGSSLSDKDEAEAINEADDVLETGSHDSLSEGEILPDQDLSEDEGLEPDQPAFIGLFRPQLFRSLLHKAQAVTGLGLHSLPASDSSVPSSTVAGPSQSLFQEPSVHKEIIPAPKLFSDVVLRQWSSPSSGPVPNSLDKRFFNVAPEFSHLLQVPSVDPPVLALSSPSPLTGPPEECLRPEERKAERTLIRGHQASAWSVQASSAASFFNRATILWLKQLQARLPPSDHRSHQDLNKIVAAIEFSADATLSAARFSAKAMGSSITSRRLLWLRNWQADIRSKWRLASSPFSGDKLFGSLLDPLLIETKDHRKVLPSLNRRPEARAQPYFRPLPFRNSEPSFPAYRHQRPFAPRSSAQQDTQGRTGARSGFKRPFRGGRGRPFRRSR